MENHHTVPAAKARLADPFHVSFVGLAPVGRLRPRLGPLASPRLGRNFTAMSGRTEPREPGGSHRVGPPLSRSGGKHEHAGFVRSAPARCRVHKDGKPGNCSRALPPPCGADMRRLPLRSKQVNGGGSGVGTHVRRTRWIVLLPAGVRTLGGVAEVWSGQPRKSAKWKWLVLPSGCVGNSRDLQRDVGGENKGAGTSQPSVSVPVRTCVINVKLL